MPRRSTKTKKKKQSNSSAPHLTTQSKELNTHTTHIALQPPISTPLLISMTTMTIIIIPIIFILVIVIQLARCVTRKIGGTSGVFFAVMLFGCETGCCLCGLCALFGRFMRRVGWFMRITSEASPYVQTSRVDVMRQGGTGHVTTMVDCRRVARKRR